MVVVAGARLVGGSSGSGSGSGKGKGSGGGGGIGSGGGEGGDYIRSAKQHDICGASNILLPCPGS